MIDFGLIDSWNPASGAHTRWGVTDSGRARARGAPRHSVPPSHQQQAYLLAARANQNLGFRFSRLCVVTFDMDGPINHPAMTAAVNEFFRRHDTFRSWFRVAADGEVHRHVVDPTALQLEPRHSVESRSGNDIRADIEGSVPGPLDWDCFSAGVIDRGSEFTVYLAIDHLHTDGISQALSCVDLMSLYVAAVNGSCDVGHGVGSYLDYCRRERVGTAKLTRDDPKVKQWTTLLEHNSKALPRFPLPLGIEDRQYARSATITIDLLDRDQAIRLDDVCTNNGVKFVSAILAAAALTDRHITGRPYFLGLTPKSTRSTYRELNTVGWFASLIPISATITAGSTFQYVLKKVDDSYRQNRSLSDVSLHRVVELLPSGFHIAADWVAPMVSFIDVRRLPGASMFDHVNFGVYGNRGCSEEVYTWVNRFDAYTTITMLYPDTPTAQRSIREYLHHFTRVLQVASAAGDFVVQQTIEPKRL